MVAQKKRLFLIDGSALAYRAYFAFIRNPLVNSRGENVSTVFGFARTLLHILDEEKPEYLAVIFDTPEPTFRHHLFSEYKATRTEMPEDMQQTLPRIREMLQALNVPLLAMSGFEADDIMGTLARRAEGERVQTVLVTGDKDMMQLVNDHTLIYHPKASGEGVEWIDAAAVVKKLGVRPSQVIDYLALAGDSSDNIPGVPGIGPVTALDLLNKYHDLESVLKHADQIPQKRARTALLAGADSARLSQQLATIHCDVPLSYTLQDLQTTAMDSDQAALFFKEMEIPSLIDRFKTRKPSLQRRYVLLSSRAEFDRFIEVLRQQSYFSFDTETTSEDPLMAELVGLSFSWQEGAAYYVPVKGPSDLTERSNPLDLAYVLSALKPIMMDPKIKKCGHNAKYDMLVLEQAGITVANLACDTMVASYLINPSSHQHNLDAVTLEYLDEKKIATKELIGSGKNQRTMDQVPLNLIAEYACEDADMTWRLANRFVPKLQEMDLHKLFVEVEMPLVHVLMHLEQTGVALDVKYLAAMSAELETELAAIETRIYTLAETKFNINSPKQLAVVLFEQLKLPTSRRTKTGYSTDVSVLEELAKEHPLPAALLEYRQLAKLKSTYVDALPRMINPRTGRLHTSFNQTVAATGRLSSSEPNLQNIPVRTEVGRRIRRAFITADHNHVLLDADYSQIELRIMAHLSGDETLRRSFMQGEDVHTRTASLIFKVEPESVTADMRRKAKEVNFGIMYGMGVYGLAQRLAIPNAEAENFIQAYFLHYPRVQEYMTETVHKARVDGYVTTLLNRRRYLPEIHHENRRMREFAERTAINTPIQGSAADLIKVAMIRIDRLLQKKYRARMILQVHDELIFEVPRDELPEVQELVRREMEHAMTLETPIKVELGVGDNWLEAH
ncbi:DNA polymerase I [bacterium]|nr:DNA polymerase I [bacterium]